MNNENPLSPQGSLLEQKHKSRSRVKTAFFCVLAVHVLAILTALIAQGCKRDQPPPVEPPPYQEPPVPAPTFDTNIPPVVDTNLPVEPPPPAVPVVTEPVSPPPPATTEYIVTKGDSFYSIGKKLGLSMKAIADANPGVDSARLKIGQKLSIPAAPAPAPGGAAAPTAADTGGQQTYVVQSGDNLTKIARKFGTTVNALRSANNLRTDRIKVGDKLKVPAPPAPAAPAPALAPAPAPMTPQPEPSPAAVPGTPGTAPLNPGQ
jgi:LysM repeat protein